jgi:hypothetical protein
MRPGKLSYQARWHRLHGNTEAAERIEAELAKAGRCRRCGRTPTDPKSVADSIGPGVPTEGADLAPLCLGPAADEG